MRDIGAFLKDKKGIRAVIAAEKEIPMLKRSAYNVLSETGELSKKKINLLTVYESKGLEFAAVAVYDEGMSGNERYIAFTRALDFLAVVSPAPAKEKPAAGRRGRKPGSKKKTEKTAQRKTAGRRAKPRPEKDKEGGI